MESVQVLGVLVLVDQDYLGFGRRRRPSFWATRTPAMPAPNMTVLAGAFTGILESPNISSNGFLRIFCLDFRIAFIFLTKHFVLHCQKSACVSMNAINA